MDEFKQIQEKEQAADKKLNAAKEIWKQETLANRQELGKILKKTRGKMPMDLASNLTGIPHQNLYQMERPNSHYRIFSVEKVMDVIRVLKQYEGMAFVKVKKGRKTKK